MRLTFDFILSFLTLHFYTFLSLLLLFSFHLFCELQLDQSRDSSRNRTVLSRYLREPLDPYVTAMHAVNRTALKRKYPASGFDRLEESARKKLYGVSRTDPRRLRALGFKPKIRSYERKDVIYVPEISPDSRRCDRWNTAQDVSYLVRCKPSDGEEACFKCIESRRFVRQCITLKRPVRVSLNFAFGGGSDEFIDLPANENEDEGYCLPALFKNITEDSEGNQRPSDITRNCNPNTGTWLLARQSDVGDTTYNWLCRCRYPNLMTNLTTIFSDCMRPVGCMPYGRLDDRAAAGLVNPYTQGTCVCSVGYEPSYDKTIGPVCIPQIVFSETNLPQDVYRRARFNMDRFLQWPRDSRYLDSRLANISGNNPNGLMLPNPCKYDAITYRPLIDEQSCELVSEKIGTETVAYCVIKNPNAVPVRASRDYLRGNNGRYANACIAVNVTNDSTTVTQTENYILSYQTSRSGENPRPDFGVLYEKSEQLTAILERLKREDVEYQRFLARVKPPKKFGRRSVGDRARVIVGDDTSAWISVYEQVPADSTELFGAFRALIDRYQDAGKLQAGVVYNLRERQYFWYCVYNPLGAVHWNHGTRADIDYTIRFWTGVLVDPFVSLKYIVRENGFQFVKGSEKERGKSTSEDDYVRYSIEGNLPKFYPGPKMTIPFASGSDIDDVAFSNQYYPTLFPIYKLPTKESRPANTLRMPFVFNTEFDLMDSTLTAHVYQGQEIYLMAEQICGEYRNHRSLMRFKLQHDFV